MVPVDDFDVELEKAEQQAKRPLSQAQAAPRSQTTPQPKQQTVPADKRPAGQPAQSKRSQPQAQAMSARRPGVFARAGDKIAQAVGRIHLPRLDATTILYGLLALIVFALLAENWSPVRINLFGVHVDVPKAVAFVVNLGLGMLLLWLLQRNQRRSAAKSEGGRS